ncbi:glutamyl-tRNA amidotransferase [Chakrabartyella piscis]|uniref:allophanate hydrolase-related protein n=1 Tax=Chakrabartyella piscis TaxID=2918914 RepID=UPI0029587D84|nr:glutamyl-tRNA amidotransferase [Chakrabartyella piscis]
MSCAEQYVLLAVNGTLMRGLELEPNMIAAKAIFQKEAKTEKTYRLWSINDIHPAMIRVAKEDTTAISVDLEVWSVPKEGLADILLNEPAGLSIGKVKLDSGEVVLGVLGEPELVVGMKEISAFGGWRKYIATI